MNEISESLLHSIAAYNEDPSGYQQRYEKVDVANLRTYFASYMPAGGRVLDAGCGTGRDVAAFAAAGFGVDGIDLSSQLLSLAIESCPDSALSLGDIRDMPFSDDTYDGVWAMASLVHLDHAAVERALVEIKRVLKPNGWLFVTLKSDESDTGRWEGGRWFSFWTLPSAQATFERAGFAPVMVEIDEGSIGGNWINAMMAPA